MARRPFWTGQLRMSLVSFGVQLYPATNPQAGISFHQIDRESGERIHHLNVVGDNKPVDKDEIVKGFEYSKGKYVMIDPEEVAKLRIETKNTIGVKQFVDLDAIPQELFEKPYFVVPQSKEPPEAFEVIRKAMEQTGKAAIGEIAFAGREHLMAIAVPLDKSKRGLMAYTLRYAEELRRADAYFDPIPKGEIDPKQLEMAVELIQRYSSPLKLEEYKDDYEDALRKLVEAKKKNLPLPLEEGKPKRQKVVNLMEALRESLDQAKKPARAERSVAERRAAAGAQKGPMLVKTSKRKHRAA